MQKASIKTTYKGGTFQFRFEQALKDEFIQLVRMYDHDLSTAKAILKLIRYAVAEQWLPGYEKKPKTVDIPINAELENLQRQFDAIKNKVKS